MVENERSDLDTYHAYMRRALDLARRGWGHTAPNPMVGAVVVQGDEIVGEGWHARYGESHAEVSALQAAGNRARGATLFVTLEPCNHLGKTPPCTQAIVAAGIGEVVIAARDPNPLARGGVERLREAGINVVSGIEEQDARELNASFFHSFASDRPWVILKLAISIDGGIAEAVRSRGWLTGESARREVHRLRAGVDAVAVGIGTVLADDPQLTVRDALPPRVPPRRIIFDSALRTPLDAAVARTARDVPTTLVTMNADNDRAAALRKIGVEILVTSSLETALRDLATAGVRSFLLEGGARLAGSFLNAGVVDRLIIFQAPVILGSGALNAFAHIAPTALGSASRLPIIDRRSFGDDLMTIYALHTA